MGWWWSDWWYEQLPLQGSGGCFGSWTVTSIMISPSSSLVQATHSQSHGTEVQMPNHRCSEVGGGTWSSTSWRITTTGPLIPECTRPLRSPEWWAGSRSCATACSFLHIHPVPEVGQFDATKSHYTSHLNPWHKQLCVSKSTARIITVELREVIYHLGTPCLGSQTSEPSGQIIGLNIPRSSRTHVSNPAFPGRGLWLS